MDGRPKRKLSPVPIYVDDCIIFTPDKSQADNLVDEQCSMVMGAIEKVILQALIDQQKCVEDRPTD